MKEKIIKGSKQKRTFILISILILFIILLFFFKAVNSNPYIFHNSSQNVFTDQKKQFAFLYPSNLEPEGLMRDPSVSSYLIMFFDKNINDPNKKYIFSLSKISPNTLSAAEQKIRQANGTSLSIKKQKINGNDAEFIKIGDPTSQLLYILIQGNGYVIQFRNNEYYSEEQASQFENNLINIASTFKQIPNK